MRFSNKVRGVILFIVLIFSTYIGYLLGSTFCRLSLNENCNLTLTTYTEWNQNFEEE